MISGLTSILMTAIAAAASYFAAPRGDSYGALRIAAVWVLTAASAFLIPNKWIVMAAIAAILIAFAPSRAAKRVFLYIGVFAAIPASFSLNVPFPGLNYLVSIDYAKVVTIILLGPIFVQKMFSAPPQHLKSVDRLLLTFVLLTGVMSIRDLPFTSMLRVTLDQFLLVFVPYVAISRTLTTQKDVEHAIKAFFVGIIILAGVGVLSTVKQWNYYVHIADFVRAKSFIDYRNGLLRIGATLIPSLLGFLVGIGIVIAFALRAAKDYPKLYFFACLGVFGLVIFATGARGAWLSAAMVVISYFLLSKLNKAGRQILIISLLAGFAGMMVLVFQDSDLLSDKYGSFDYRAELVRTSMRQLADRPLFGSADFINTARFAHLRQGEGIIDLVNVYIQLSLYYGLVGLSLFIGANFLVMRGGLTMLGRLPFGRGVSPDVARVHRIVSLLIAMQIGYLVLISTISAVSYIWHCGYILLALLAAQVRVGALAAQPTEQQSKIPPDEEPSPAPSALKPDAPLPYGARFVRRP